MVLYIMGGVYNKQEKNSGLKKKGITGLIAMASKQWASLLNVA